MSGDGTGDPNSCLRYACIKATMQISLKPILEQPEVEVSGLVKCLIRDDWDVGNAVRKI